MLAPHRSAFNNGNSQNEALEYNLDKVVNMTSLKVKELISKKQDKIRENNLLRGQKSVMESDIMHCEKETKEKEQKLISLANEFETLNGEIEQIEKEYKELLNDYNEKNENLKLTVNSVNNEMSIVTVAEGVEETNKISEMKKEYEKYLVAKNENKLLMEKMHELRRELYYLEISYKEAADNEIQRIYKAKKGIETINKLY